jgi:trimeric autotransporter adhesin
VVYGVSGNASSRTDGAAAVHGFEAATTGEVFGVIGGTNSSGAGAAGVWGFASSALGGNGVGAYAASANGIGILAGNGGGGLAGRFDGNVRINGSLSVTATKNYQIDDPVDPGHKYLYHASIESSEMLNVYSGNATLDDKGEAEITLSAWIEALHISDTN